MISIIDKRRIPYLISGLLVAASIIMLFILPPKVGIDFTGGSLLEIAYSQERPESAQIAEAFNSAGIESVTIQSLGEDGYNIRFQDISEDTRREILTNLKAQVAQVDVDSLSADGAVAGNQLIERQFETIGPVIGDELRSKSIQALIIVLLAIVLYIAWAFRKVSWPIQSWKYGIVALITLFHDIVIVLGAFTILSNVYGWEINTPFVAAILTILGYSVNDTIVVFDRIRENVPRMSGGFAKIVNAAVNQTISRSINTSFTTMLVLLAILFFGGQTIQDFIATLVVGVLVGTYSSIFIASPLLVSWQENSKKSA